MTISRTTRGHQEVERARAVVPDDRQRRTLDDVFVAELRCRNMRCRARTVGIRRPDEWPDWEHHSCGRCRRPNPVVVGEVLAVVELDAAAGVLRWRPAEDESAAWRYLAMPALPPRRPHVVG